MNLVGQAVFSAELVRGAGPRRLRTIALCTVDDQVLRPLAVQYGIEVVVDDGIVILATADRELPIWIGAAEAEALAAGLQDVELPRPNAHALALPACVSLVYA